MFVSWMTQWKTKSFDKKERKKNKLEAKCISQSIQEAFVFTAFFSYGFQ